MTDFTIQKGSTFSRVLRWETSPFVYTPITAITKAAPAVVTAVGHGLVDGWRAAIISVVGMRQINSKNSPLRSSDFHKVSFVSSTQVGFNDTDSSLFGTYTSGGYLCSYTPVDLAGFTARMQIRASAEAVDPPLLSLVSPTDITLDNTAKAITITITATVTAAFTFAAGVYALELVSATGVVTQLLSGNIIVLDEVTR